MNIAVVIGISNYIDSKNNLPGCRNDADAIYNVLLKTEKFSQVLFINNGENSAKTKELLTNFISDFKGKQIDELFFYFSGHGEFINEEFFYILSDFDAKKRNQTSLQNTEVDDLIRTLSPELVIKVVDACQSGTTYIKESNGLSKYFNERKMGFKNCYFLNSSLSNQSSFQNSEISFFTLSFLNALKEHKADEIRYKDIIDFISDFFIDYQEQTPFFIVQADYTEKFCVFSKNLKEYLEKFSDTAIEPIEQEKITSIYDLIKLDAKDYADKEKTLRSVTFFGKEISKVKLTGELGTLYSITIKLVENYAGVSKLDVIQKWIDENPNDLFTAVETDTAYDPEEGFEHDYVSGFNLRIDVPFKSVTIEINSLYPNIPSYRANVIFLFSKKIIRFFYFITNYRDESWDNKFLNYKDIQWRTIEAKIIDDLTIKEAVEKMENSIRLRIEKDLEGRFNTFLL